MSIFIHFYLVLVSLVQVKLVFYFILYFISSNDFLYNILNKFLVWAFSILIEILTL